MENQTSCGCTGESKLIFSCSGGADVGELADRSARTLTKNKDGKMFCLAGIGGRVSGIMASTESAPKILAIDGCKLNCAKKTLEEAGFTNFEHLLLTDLGFMKTKTTVNDENIKVVTEKAKELLVCK